MPSREAGLELGRLQRTAQRHLAAGAADLKWIEADVALDLISGDRESATRTLERASDQWPDTPLLQLYQAIGYAEEAISERRGELFGLAYDLLSQLSRSTPSLRTLALYNRAVLDEHMLLYGKAIEDWEWCLTNDVSKEWKEVALRRREALRGRLNFREEPIPEAKDFLSGYRSGQYRDEPLERVIEAVIRRWHGDTPADYETLKDVAGIAIREHGDPWLDDLIRGVHDADWSAGMMALAQASRLNASDQRSEAVRQAEVAIRSFRRAGNDAGWLAAMVENLYAVNRSLVVKACLAAGQELEPEFEKRHYALLLVRYGIEMSGCLGRSDFLPEAEANLKRAMLTAQAAHYPALNLRVLTVLSNHHVTSGNSTAAWEDCWEGINRFWMGKFGAVRGHSLYYNCSLTAERLGQREFSLALAQEASRFAGGLPGPIQAAEGYIREGLLAAQLEDWEAAGSALERGRKALEALPEDEVRYRHLWGLERAMVEADLRQGRPASALQTLARFGAMLPKSEQPHERTNYYLLRARAAALGGDHAEQYRCLTLAAAETEGALSSLLKEEDRIRWRNQSASVFRPLVEQTLAQPEGIRKGLALWERYLDRTLEPGRREEETGPSLNELGSATLLSFVWLTDHLGYWVGDERGADFVWVPQPPARISELCRRFARECSDESVPEPEVRRTGRELHRALFDAAKEAPAWARIRDGRKLLIEVDGELGGIPFEALVDASGGYLGQAHAVVYSSGLRRWTRLRKLGGIAAGSRALIVAAPSITGELARQFPPLPDARREGEMVAGLFRNSTILTGRDGTLRAVLAAVGDAEIIHFSGHALANSDDGALLLAGSSERESGALLTTSEIASRSLSHCRLAVLSACSTGVGERRGPVNPNSLVNGLLRGGVRDVVASRWKVDSAATYQLMRRFYQGVKGTGDAAVALQDAMAELRGLPGLGHPHYWASFSMFGE